jgi:hypothetical protein
MRLSDVLSKAPDAPPEQVEGFLDDRPLSWGKHKKIKVGRVFHNFHCKLCDDQRTFQSGDELYCLGLGDRAVSIDATLKCTACGASELIGTPKTCETEPIELGLLRDHLPTWSSARNWHTMFNLAPDP